MPLRVPIGIGIKQSASRAPPSSEEINEQRKRPEREMPLTSQGEGIIMSSNKYNGKPDVSNLLQLA